MSVWKYLLIIVIIFIIFGAGKLPKVMEDLGRGVRLFKKGLKGDDKPKGKSKTKPRKKVKPLAKKSKRPPKKKK
jgi:sec-independent protein translocase protein TatA